MNINLDESNIIENDINLDEPNDINLDEPNAIHYLIFDIIFTICIKVLTCY